MGFRSDPGHPVSPVHFLTANQPPVLNFCDAVLEFDPKTRRFEFPTLEVKDAYHQVAYLLSAKGEFFATGSNIREKAGKFNRDRAGEVVFW